MALSIRLAIFRSTVGVTAIDPVLVPAVGPFSVSFSGLAPLPGPVLAPRLESFGIHPIELHVANALLSNRFTSYLKIHSYKR